MHGRARRRRPGPPSSNAPRSRRASISRSINSPSSRTRRLPRCMRRASSSFPTTTSPARSMTRRRRSARAQACRPTRFPTMRGRAPNAGTTSSIGGRATLPASGPGAHGRLDSGGVAGATATEKRPESWVMGVESLGHGVVTDEALTREQMADEFLLMGLRLAEGIDPARYARLAGRPLDPRRIALLREQGAVETTANGMLRLTLAGFPVLDAVVADLAA